MKSKYYYLRLGARILGLIACFFYMFLAFKGGLGEVMQGRGSNLVPFFPYLAIAVAGYPVAFVQEKKGGYLMLAGGIALFIFFLVYSGGVDWIRAIVYGMPFILCGAAFVYCSGKE